MLYYHYYLYVVTSVYCLHFLSIFIIHGASRIVRKVRISFGFRFRFVGGMAMAQELIDYNFV